MNFGSKLRTLRVDAGLTQDALAKQLGISKAVVSYYERQERLPSPEVLARIADVFHITSDYLLGIGRRQILDVSDLTSEDIQFLVMTADTLRSRSTDVS